MIRKTNVGLVLVVCLLPLSMALAQGPTTGRIEGTVKDQNGAVIPGAEVKVINRATANERTATTDDAGHYETPLLLPGVYQVSIAASGFNLAIFETVQVSITETTLVNADLIVKGVNVDPVVVRVAPLIQADGPQLGRTVDSRMISELPLATRNFTQILSLSPGVATYLPDSTGVGRNTQTISVNGARMTQNNVQINGIDANTMGTSAAVNLAIPAPETVQEVKVQTSLYDATFGRSGGGNVQIITRSGTNEFHGSLYEYFRNDALNANNPFLKAASVKRPVLKRNVFGGTVGGPMKRDRAFFFVSYQGTRESNGASILNSISSSVLVARGLTDDRSEQTLLQTFKPLANGQPATSINPIALALLNVKLPNGQFLIPTPQTNGRYSGSAISRFREDQFNGNIDYRISHKNWLAAKFFLANTPSTIALPSFRGTGPNVPGFGARQANNVRVFAIQDVHIFSPRSFNELRVGFNIHRNLVSPSEPVKDSDLGIKRSNADVFPGLGLIRIAPAAGGIIVGTQTNISPAFAWVAIIADTLAITRVKHFVRTGAEFRFNEVDLAQQLFKRGQIDFLNFNNFLIGASSVSTFGNGIGDRKQRAADYNFFLQDDWKLSQKLTLNLGLRYELDLPPFDKRGRLSTFDPSLYRPRLQVGSDGLPVGPPIGGFVQAGNVIPQYDLPEVPNVSKYVVRSIDPNNFAPRVGFAYSPFDSGHLVLRGGYGIFYSRATFQYVSTSVTVPPTYLLGRRTNPPSFAEPFPSVPPQGQFPIFVEGVALSGTVLDRGIRTPYFQQYNASVQYQVARDTVLEVAYVGTRGSNLFRQVGINQARLASPQHPIINDVTGAVITTNTPQNPQQRAPFQGVDINGFFQNQSTAQSSYNSLQISLTRRLTRGLQLLGSYTYAKSLDNASGTGGGAGIVGIVNPGAVADTSLVLGDQLNNRANRGLSDFDRTHRFVLTYIWDLPKPAFAKRSTAGRWLLSDWKVAGIIVAMSGLPVDIVDTGAGSLYGLSGGGNPLARPNWAPGAIRGAATSNVPEGFFFNPIAFARPIVLTGRVIPSSGGRAISGPVAPGAPFGTDIGNVGRNVLRGPRQTNVDFSVIKRFPFGESRSVEFRTEVFNLFNHVNLANPISDLNAVSSSGGSIDANTGQIISPGDFGRIISTSNNPRLMQFALKLNF